MSLNFLEWLISQQNPVSILKSSTVKKRVDFAHYVTPNKAKTEPNVRLFVLWGLMTVPKPVKLDKKDVLDLQLLLPQPQDQYLFLKSKNSDKSTLLPISGFVLDEKFQRNASKGQQRLFSLALCKVQFLHY